MAGDELIEGRLRLPVVEAREHVALIDLAALAAAELDDALAHQRRDLGPSARLDHAGCVNNLGGATACDGGDLHRHRPGEIEVGDRDRADDGQGEKNEAHHRQPSSLREAAPDCRPQRRAPRVERQPWPLTCPKRRRSVHR